ncbi:hypothetical protein GCM10017788_40410 [Amycolatopsis acidiphila]|nr:hypothetical protein GCM10017788_40410 [Amycolatopsis acidiphila]
MESPWFLVVPGAVAVVAGIAIPAFPQATLGVIAFVFPVVLVVIGVFRILSAFLSPRLEHGRRRVLTGTLLVLAALLALPQADQSLHLLTLLLAAYWIISGLNEAIRVVLRGRTPERWLDLTAAVLRILAGITALVYGSVALLVLVWLLGLQLLLCGAITVWVGLDARRAASHP